MAEDHIFEKYEMEIEQVYKFLADYEHEVSVENEGSASKSSTQRRSKLLNAKIAQRLSIFTIEEDEDANSSMSSL